MRDKNQYFIEDISGFKTGEDRERQEFNFLKIKIEEVKRTNPLQLIVIYFNDSGAVPRFLASQQIAAFRELGIQSHQLSDENSQDILGAAENGAIIVCDDLINARAFVEQKHYRDQEVCIIQMISRIAQHEPAQLIGRVARRDGAPLIIDEVDLMMMQEEDLKNPRDHAA